MKNNTHPIGRGTDNVTVNMPHDLHSKLGREAAARGYKSKGQFIRAAIRELLKKGVTFCLSFVLWGAAALIGAEAFCGIVDEARRGNNRVPRVVRGVKEGKLL